VAPVATTDHQVERNETRKAFDPMLMKSSENDEMPKDAVKANKRMARSERYALKTGS
jgi:hypothetical protein